MKNLLLVSIIIIGFVTSTFAQNIPSYIPTDGLIGWWPFDGNANDESGNNNNGTNNGAVLTTDRFGHADSAYLFNGTSSYISIPSSASLESPDTGLSMTAWINLAGSSLVGQPFSPIFMKSDNSGNAFMYRFYIDLNATGVVTGTNVWTNNAGASYHFNLNQWYLVSAILDKDSAFLYVNDTLINAQPFITSITKNSLPLELGRDVPGYTEVFNGKLDDIGIWNRALTHDEVKAMYKSCTTVYEHQSITACGSYTSPSGKYTWTKSGHYGDVLTSVSGCDTSIDIDLAFLSPSDSVTQNGATLTAFAGGVDYQWMDCDNNFAAISGATNQEFTATANGNYSVIVSQNQCPDTSVCFSVTGLGMNEIKDANSFELFPNPATDNMTIQLLQPHGNVRMDIFNPLGQLLYAETINQKSEIINLTSFASGVYLVQIQTPYFTVSKRMTVVK